jgi:hypothetical protein
MFKLEPCDVLLHVNETKGWTQDISRWGIGKYGHVSMFVGHAVLLFGDIPFVFESTGRGTALHSLQSLTGDLVLVMRPSINLSWKEQVISNAITLVNSPQAYYDYFTIITSCIPRVLKSKLPFPLNLLIPVKYHRDVMVICSEAVAEVFWRSDVKVLPEDTVPLPGDFESSGVLSAIGQGRIMEDVLP